jgi:hypothetical protein
MTSPK